MELRSSRGECTGHNVDLDVNNEQGPYHDAVVVIFNLDTTDLRTKNCEICQIAASCNGKKFQVYIMPDGHNIALNATAEHGIKLRRTVSGYNMLQKHVHGWEIVNSFAPREGLTKFLDFLGDLTGQTRKVLLAAHGCSQFQRHILVRQLKVCDLFDAFQSLVLGTIDTMEVFKQLESADQPTKKQKKPDKLESLAAKYLENYVEGQRDAQRSVEILESLINVKGRTDAILKEHVKDLDVFIRSIDLKNDLGDVAVSQGIREKIASAGITIDVLKDEYRTNGNEGISTLLKDVTEHKKVIQKLVDKLSELV